jgi:hypothetical protein
MSLLIKFLELVPERKTKTKTYKSNYKYIVRILKRNLYTFRTKTHWGQVLDNNCYILISNFLNEVYNIRYENAISSSILGNMDETPLFLNMPITKTIVKKGSRQVIVKTQNQEK